MITRLYRIHGHVRISNATFPGMYASLMQSLGYSPMTYLYTVLPLTFLGYVDISLGKIIKSGLVMRTYQGNLHD